MSSAPKDPSSGSGPDRPERGWRAHAWPPDPDDPLLLEHLGIVIPDDPRALLQARHTPHLPHDARALRTPLLIVLVTLAALVSVIAVSGSLIGVLSPRSGVEAPGAFAVAEHPGAVPGDVGGLLPDVGLRLDDAIGMSARDLRPAVMFVPPAAPCPTCAQVLGALDRQAGEYGLRVYAVTPPESADAARALLSDSGAPSAHLLVDPAGAVTAAFRGATARVVLVHADGVVGAVLTDPSARGRYEQVLSPLRRPGAPPSLRPAAVVH